MVIYSINHLTKLNDLTKQRRIDESMKPIYLDDGKNKRLEDFLCQD